MPDSKAKRRWDKANVTTCTIKLFRSTDRDILHFLEAKSLPKATVIKAALREYMKREGKAE